MTQPETVASVLAKDPLDPIHSLYEEVTRRAQTARGLSNEDLAHLCRAVSDLEGARHTAEQNEMVGGMLAKLMQQLGKVGVL